MRTTFLAIALTTAVFLAPAQTVGAAPISGASIARFEGVTIDLRNGWGEATACASDGITTNCFRTESALDKYLSTTAAASQPIALGAVSIQSTCATALRLYSGAGFSGSILALTTRQAVLNLSTWAFSNVTSSYSVGACYSTLYDGANAVTPIYPGNTSAGASASSMVAGWDNRVSSVYIS
jgi:hypothetical protein